MGIIHINKVKYEYIRRDEENNVEGITTAVDGVSLAVEPGEFIAILGHNGSGKSTLAKHINAILYPSEGSVVVDGMDTQDEEHLLQIRQTAGMVFQNPDNQIIGQIVEEDVGFGPENMGVPTKEIWERVKESLKAVGMYEYRSYSPNKLSGGQKQRVSIASVIAMHPKCIILDEPTAMLDPMGRREVIRAVRALNDVEKITMILITHYMEEVIYADRVFVMDKGKVAMGGTPKEIFSRVSELRDLRLDVPQVTELAYELKCAGVPLPDGILTREELTQALQKVKKLRDPHS
ncbi:MAG: energy-coupling factor transporter ATPase [Lachnospiraceae bacterium]|nr:energy-coupling factor transporter ATPase [Lachnospiraceae bacterium]MBR6156213.1 energy-coupling factor transporter ATPase [Lachnospiraceae bacterium]MBR6850411.1 energy-coupling factor transporter ATPase [Lachnospiraceae bacterium]